MDGSIVRAITLDQLEKMCDKNSNLRGYLHGYIAEEKLEEHVRTIDGVSEVVKIKDSDHRKGDLLVTYKGQYITIEAKSLESRRVKFDFLTGSWRAPVQIKASGAQDLLLENGKVVRTTSLRPGRFDILAIGCFAVTGSWDFLFLNESMIPIDHKTGLLKTCFTIDPLATPGLTQSLPHLLEEALK